MESVANYRRSDRGSRSLRFAVYLHHYDPDPPLNWQHGQVTDGFISLYPRLTGERGKQSMLPNAAGIFLDYDGTNGFPSEVF
jgi:hypothetical protein